MLWRLAAGECLCGYVATRQFRSRTYRSSEVAYFIVSQSFDLFFFNSIGSGPRKFGHWHAVYRSRFTIGLVNNELVEERQSGWDLLPASSILFASSLSKYLDGLLCHGPVDAWTT